MTKFIDKVHSTVYQMVKAHTERAYSNLKSINLNQNQIKNYLWGSWRCREEERVRVENDKDKKE